MGTAAAFGNAQTSFPNKPSTGGVRGRVDFKVIGDKKILADFTRMQQLPQRGITKVLQLMASEFMASLVTFAPVNTGRYINSWRIKENGRNKVVVGPVGILPPRATVTGGQSKPISAAKLAHMLEFTGAGQHIIEPRVAGALTFRNKQGDVITRSRVNHPGFRPVPHIRMAVAETRRKAKGISYAVAAEFAPVPKWRQSLGTKARQEGYSGSIPPRQTGRNRKDTSANITRGTKGNFKAKLSRPGGLSGTRIRARGKVRAIGTNESGLKQVRKSGTKLRKTGLTASNQFLG